MATRELHESLLVAKPSQMTDVDGSYSDANLTSPSVTSDLPDTQEAATEFALEMEHAGDDSAVEGYAPRR